MPIKESTVVRPSIRCYSEKVRFRKVAMPQLIFQSIGPAELLIILAIVVVLFGAGRIAGLGGALGSSIRSFRRELKEPDKEEHSDDPSEQPDRG